MACVKLQKMDTFIAITIITYSICTVQASVKRAPLEVCRNCCNTPMAVEHIGFDNCMKSCPDCGNLGPTEWAQNATTECENFCLPPAMEDPVRLILCRNKCPALWCATQTNAFEPTISPDEGNNPTGFDETVIIVIAVCSASSLIGCVLIIGLIFWRRHRVESDENIAVKCEQCPEGDQEYWSLPLAVSSQTPAGHQAESGHVNSAITVR